MDNHSARGDWRAGRSRRLCSTCSTGHSGIAIAAKRGPPAERGGEASDLLTSCEISLKVTTRRADHIHVGSPERFPKHRKEPLRNTHAASIT